MDRLLIELPWLIDYWVGVSVARVILMTFVFFWFGRAAFQGVLSRLVAIGIPALAITAWLAVDIYLGSRNLLRIHTDVSLPPPILATVLVPLLVGYLAFQYWAPFRRLIFAIPQHWLIALQVYRITGSVFLLVYAADLIPGAFALVSGWGDLITGLLAIPVVYLVYKRTAWAHKSAVAWNYLGLFELILLIPLGLLTSPSPIQTLALDNPNLVTSVWPSVLAPTFHVPMGILLHIFSLAALRQESPARVPVVPQRIGWQLMTTAAVSIFAYVMLFYVMTPLLTPRLPASHVYPGLGQILQSHTVGLYVHILPSALALILGPMQLHAGVRKRFRQLHRITGRIYITSVMTGGAGAFYIAQFSFAGLGSRLGFSTLAIVLLFTCTVAYRQIRSGEVQSHQEWMIRNYSLIFAAVMLRVYNLTFFSLGYELPDFHVLNSWLCWVPNLLVAELIIRTRRNRNSTGNNTMQPVGTD